MSAEQRRRLARLEAKQRKAAAVIEQEAVWEAERRRIVLMGFSDGILSEQEARAAL